MFFHFIYTTQTVYSVHFVLVWSMHIRQVDCVWACDWLFMTLASWSADEDCSDRHLREDMACRLHMIVRLLSVNCSLHSLDLSTSARSL